ncbi:MmpS family transport accessory protein [Actinokineospora iranica]|uniref:Membrane protein n=1 Tax=Actinokineospora iranica TaxID=1271860 RepID=A0A1G6XG21_9PSEU|nr:MmpS family transport accessory protein [Actinokineospora iranica]SDD76275.1 membrane protein [Actinokineospora iranica]
MSETPSTVTTDVIDDPAGKVADSAPDTDAAVESPESETDSTPPVSQGRKFAERTWWLPWLLGIAALAAAVLVITQAFGGDPTPEEQIQERRSVLPSSTHTVVYEVNGTGKSPEIRYVVDGSAGTETVEGVDLPWRKEVTMTVGPGIGIAQLLAANGDGESVSCAVSVDGQVVNQGVSPGQYTNVACSAVIRPNPAK